MMLFNFAGEKFVQVFHINVGLGSPSEGAGKSLLQYPLSMFVEPSTQAEK